MELVAKDDPDPDAAQESHALEEAALEERINLNEQRIGAVAAALKSSGAKRVLDLGCGEGRLLQTLLKEKSFAEIVGMDVSYRALEIAGDRLKLDRLPPRQRARIKRPVRHHRQRARLLRRAADAARKAPDMWR